jgi:hypothetical protein
MGRVDSGCDNALAERQWQILNREAMYKMAFSTMRQARLEMLRWLAYHNARRRHSALAYLSPMEFRTAAPHDQRTLTLGITPVSTFRGSPQLTLLVQRGAGGKQSWNVSDSAHLRCVPGDLQIEGDSPTHTLDAIYSRVRLQS